MKNKFKFVILFQFIFIFLSAFNFFTVNASETNTKNLYIENCNKSLQIYSEIVQYFYNSSQSRIINSEFKYNDNYCGAFIDGDGILNVGYIDDINLPSFDNQVIYEKREFSYNYLLQLKEIISEKIIEYNIDMVGIDEEDNEVEVYFSDNSYVSELLEHLQIIGLYHNNAINIIIDENKSLKLNAKTAYGGDKINDTLLGFEYGSGTICVNVIDNDTGKYGVLTNAHVATANTTMYHDGSLLRKIGVAEKRKQSGTIDAAFVPFAKQEKWDITTNSRGGGIIYNNVRLGNENLIIQGAPTRKLGQTSGNTTGLITSTNFDCKLTYDTGPEVIKNTIMYSNQSLPGDSGGPVYYDDGTNLFLIAMNFAGSSDETQTFGIGCNIFNVFEEFNLTPILNGSVYETTDLENNEIRIDRFFPKISNYSNNDNLEFEIPAYINDKPVTQIGSLAFESQDNITSIILPSTLDYIGDSAFKNCSSLSKVIIKRDCNEIISLGLNVFDGCSTDLQIDVPKNRIFEYRNAVNWNLYKNKIMTSDTLYNSIELDCLSDGELNVTLEKGYNTLIQVNNLCTKSYRINCEETVLMKIYNEDSNEIYSNIGSSIVYLNPGVYFLDVRYPTFDESGTFVINYKLNFPSNGTLVYNNMVNEINSCVHATTNNLKHALLIFENADGEGMYRFKLNAGNDDLYPEGSVRICSDIKRNSPLYRYGMSDVSIYAETSINENELYVYLPNGGCYYIEVNLYNNTYSNVTFEISNVETNNIDYLDYFNDISFDVLFEAKKVENYFEEVVINQRSKVQLDIISESILTDCVPVFIFEKILEPGYDIGDEYFYLEPSFIGEITPDYWAPVYTIILDPGTYYFGYHNNFDNAKINFALRRIVDYDENAENVLVSDPHHEGYELGSEVKFNNGECNNYTITEGFTRNIYLMVEDRLRDPMSRLEYDWYSSNENIAIVTKYGTVLAMPVDIDTTVTIYAALKTNPSIVYYKTFTILNDIEEELIEIECEMTYSIRNDTPLYKLELDSTNCPFPMVQYYSWTLFNESDETVNIDKWGYVTSSGPTEVLVVGTYNLNPRVIIFINLTIIV